MISWILFVWFFIHVNDAYLPEYVALPSRSSVSTTFEGELKEVEARRCMLSQIREDRRRELDTIDRKITEIDSFLLSSASPLTLSLASEGVAHVPVSHGRNLVVTVTSDKSILQGIASSIGNKISPPWTASSDPCSTAWVGVLCDSDGYVTKIDLSYTKLSGRM